LSLPRTLLLTSTRPGESSVGELFLRDLCKLFPKDKLVCFAAVGPDYEIGIPSPQLDWLPMQVCKVPQERVTKHGAPKPASTLRCLARLAAIKREVEPIISNAVRYAQEQKVERIWAVIAGPAMVYIAKEVAQRLKLPMTSLVWDPLDYVCKDRGYEEFTRGLIMKQFDRAIALSENCGTASDGMKEYIQTAHNRPCEALIMSPGEDLVVDRGPELMTEHRLIIGFAGSMYARTEFEMLINSLRTVGWRIAGRDVTLRLLGNALSVPVFAGGHKCHVEFLGFHQDEEVIQALATTDVAYLPYWFDPEYASAVKQSFPNKFATYLSAGCPVFFHGPEDSSPTRFLQRYPVGVACHSLDASQILATLERFVTDSDMRERAVHARRQALSEELNSKVLQRRFAKLLGADMASLKG
jgi:Glycosyl transferases group 1